MNDLVITVFTDEEKKALEFTFGKKPMWDATEMQARLRAEMLAPEFDYTRAQDALKEVWWHWKNNYKAQGRKKYQMFYEGVILYYDEVYARTYLEQ